MYDCIIKNVLPFYEDGLGELIDVAVCGGKIAKVQESMLEPASRIIDAGGRILIPSFVDSHTHLDKVLIGTDEDAGGLLDAIRIAHSYEEGIHFDMIHEDVLNRSEIVAGWQISHGTGFVKTHVIGDSVWGLRSLKPLEELKNRLKGQVDIRLIVPWMETEQIYLHDLAKARRIDFVGGYPALKESRYQEEVDSIFNFACRYDIPIDLHVNESDVADIDCFTYVLKKTIETGMQGRVTCGHVTALCAVDEDTAKRAVELAAKAEVNIITLPSCNMYLMGRNDKGIVRRGLTRVDDFMSAGVSVSLASDNIRDPFRPFGNGDMLEEALFTAQVLQYGTRQRMEQILRMATYLPAENMLLTGYGLREGCNADLVLLDGSDIRTAIVSNARRMLIMKDGKILHHDSSLENKDNI